MKKTPYEVLAQLKEMATVLVNYHFSLANKVEVHEYSKVQSNTADGPRIVLSPKNGQHMTIYVTPDGDTLHLHQNDLHCYTDDAKAFIGKFPIKYIIYASWFEPADIQQTENPTLGDFSCMTCLRFAELNSLVDLRDPQIVGKTVSAGRMPEHSMYERMVEVLHIFDHDGNPEGYVTEWFSNLEHAKKGEFDSYSLVEHCHQLPIYPEIYLSRIPQ